MVLINLELSSGYVWYEQYDNNTINNLQLSFLKVLIKFKWFFYMSKGLAK